MAYDEGVLVGHRWYDARGIEPPFPFGHGLGYGQVEWSTVPRPAVAPATASLELTVTLVNAAPREVSQVVQSYAARHPLPPGAPPRSSPASTRCACARASKGRSWSRSTR